MKELFLRDLSLAFRSGGGGGQALGFFVLVVTLMAFGVGPEQKRLATIAPGALWVFALLAALLSIDRLFQADQDDGALDLIALGPAPLEGVVLMKAAAHWVTTGLPLAILSPVLGPLLRLPSEAAPFLALSLLIGTPALSLIGAVGAALTVGVRRGGLLLSLLVLPLFIPTLIFGGIAASGPLTGVDPTPSLFLLAATSLGSFALAPFAAAAALRANVS
jgi:heme exporter protein B